ncbi:SagB family peptide dehydrogenase [Mycobacterium sherrisii]|uniref:SagB family peptide dehydrogenase n=1 Tax=Mycobacterium sherrisii TaxID=243061 RepID=UPI003976B72B
MDRIGALTAGAPYPVQTRFAFRTGVTCVTTSTGAVLLDPPHSEKLAKLAPGGLQALKTLNSGPATLSEMSTSAELDEVGALLDRLAAAGWLTITVRDQGRDLYSVVPFARPASRPPGGPPAQSVQPLVMSKFAVLHRDSAGFVLEHPLGWCDVRIHDANLLALLDGSIPDRHGVTGAVAAQFLRDLRWSAILVSAGADEAEFDTIAWSAPDLWFHRRSTLGQRTVAWEDFGPTRWARGRFPQPPARRMNYPSEPIVLSTTDLTTTRAQDPTLTAVLEDRISTRAFDDSRPMTVQQLSELLYRTARTRGIVPVGDGEHLLSRPYPSSGGLYELELYPVVRNVAGLRPAMYHYDSFDHVLRPVATADSRPVSQLIKAASATLAGGAEPQVLVVIAARSGRITWTYQQICYATILKDVGVLMQTIYLAATAMKLGACAQGYSDTAAFAAATGVDELQECSVGSIVVGSPVRN